jgi:hypothetical protein
MDANSSEFLEAFYAIEDWLRRRAQAGPGADFHEVVELVADGHGGVRRCAHLLKKFGRLRNFLVHEYSRDRPMTVPTPYAVERIAALRDELISPPALHSVSNQPVVMCGPADPVGGAARKMRDGPYSQPPVYDGGAFVGLLTAETVARWVRSPPRRFERHRRRRVTFGPLQSVLDYLRGTKE